MVISALARAHELDVTLLGPAVQCRFAESLGLKAIPLELPRAQTLLVGPWRLISHALRISRIARKLKADLVYANASRAMGYGLAVRILGGFPLIIHNHHLLGKKDKTLIEGHVMSRAAFVRSMEKWADLIINPSKAAAEAFRPSPKLKVIPNGIDLHRFRPTAKPGAAKTALGLAPDLPVVGTVTRADHEKGMMAFLEVAERVVRKVPDVQFLLAGGVSFPHEKTHWAKIQNRATASLGDRIVLTGRLDDPVPAFQAMDIMLHTSELKEVLPTTAIEAMATGVPVIGFDWGGLTEVIDSSCGVLTPPNDLAEMCEQVVGLLGKKELREQMARSARQRAETQFSLERFVTDLTVAVRETCRR